MGAAQRAEVVAEVRRRTVELQDAVLAAVTGAVDAYRGLAPDQLRDVRGIATWGLLRIVDSWCQGADLLDADLARLRGVGAARAEDGRPLPDVLRAYRVAAVAATDIVLELGGDRLTPRDVADLARVVLVAVDQMSEAVIAGHTAAVDRLTGDRARALRDLLDDLLIGRQSAAGAFADRSRHLGYQLPAEPAVLVAGPVSPAPEHVFRAATAMLSGPGPDGGSPSQLLTTRGAHAVLLVPAQAVPHLGSVLQAHSWRGCTVPAADSTRVAAAHQLAAHALDTAPAHAFIGRSILDEGDARVLALISGRSGTDLGEVARAVLGPLLEPRHRHLLDGLVARLAAVNDLDAATALGLHPQSMRHRGRRALALTGRDPRDPWHRLTLDVATHAAARRALRP